MFTGIIRNIGTVKRIESMRGGKRIAIEIDKTIQANIGDSIAVDGVCLTVVNNSTYIEFDVVEETLRKSTLKHLKPGQKVNIEPSLKLGDTIDGHLVYGHIDCTARILKIVPRGIQKEFEFELPSKIRRFVAEKGSIAIDGISLTVVGVKQSSFLVAIVPHTLSATTLQFKHVGDEVNIEVDIIARYLDKRMEGIWR